MLIAAKGPVMWGTPHPTRWPYLGTLQGHLLGPLGQPLSTAQAGPLSEGMSTQECPTSSFRFLRLADL
jgi:hypothetical protein